MFIDITFFGKIAFQSPRPRKFVSDTIAQAIFEMMLLGCLFQSPRSGKFVSNCRMTKRLERGVKVFQSPRSGKFVSNCRMTKRLERGVKVFQSPRSGKFVSDLILEQAD